MTDSSVFLVQYGRPGFVGQFHSALPLGRGDIVVIQGPRGMELGEVLVPTHHRSAGPASQLDGDIVRMATPEDETVVGRYDPRGRDLLAAAAAGGRRLELPLAFVDVELMLDGTAILHTAVWGECDATPLLDELTAQTGLTIRLLDLSRGRTPEVAHSRGCSKPGCGSETGGCSSCGTGGGCSTGSCSRGSVKSSEELTAYFADLRWKMEEAGISRTPLN